MKHKFVYDWDTTDLLGSISLSCNGITEQNFRLFRNNYLDLHKFESFYSYVPTYSMVPYERLKKSESYIYCIQVANHGNYFLRKFEHNIEIPDHVRSDVFSGRAIVVFQYVFEGMLYLNHYEEFCNIVSRLQLPAKSVVILHGDFITEKFHNNIFSYEPYDTFPSWIPSFSNIIDYVPEKLFVTYNRNARLHRIILIANLIKNNLVNDGILSLGKYEDNTGWFQKQDRSLTAQDCNRLTNYIRVSPDNLDLEKENPANTINIEHHRRSFVSLVSETLIENTVSFFSEKIYKPISLGHPFILLGNPGSLKRLRNQGYRTFSNWWNEDYDSEQNWVLRIHKIMRILEQLQRIPDRDKILMRNDMRETLEHNRRLFIEIRNKTNNYELLNTIFDQYLL